MKNDNHLLPLDKAPATIAVIGPNADSLDTLVGNYYGKPSKPVTVLDGIRARFPNARSFMPRAHGLVGPEELAIPDDALCIDVACAAPWHDGGRSSPRTIPPARRRIATRSPTPTRRWSGEEQGQFGALDRLHHRAEGR